MIIREVILECRACEYRTGGGHVPLIIESKSWLKKKIKARRVICPKCEQSKRFKIVYKGGSKKTYYPGEMWN